MVSSSTKSEIANGYIYFSSIVGIVIWAIVGFIAWIPILIYAASTFCLDVIRASIENSHVSEDSNIQLRNKIDIYPRGFRNFYLVMSESNLYDSD